MRSTATLVAAIGLLTGVPAPAAVDSQDDAVDQIVVVASKSERSIRDVAANVTVISAAEVSAELASSMSDMLRYTPGIDDEGAGTRFGTEGVNIRGIGGNRVALLIDGVPLGDQFDVGSFSNATRDFVNAGFVDRAEILHGPASALYGSAAIGGVVAFETPDPAYLAGDSGLGGRLTSVWRGADDSWNGTALQAWSGDRLRLLAGAGYRRGSEAESAATAIPLDTRDYNKRSGLLKAQLDDPFGNTLELSVYSQHSAIRSSLSSMLGSGRYRSTTALEGDDRYRMDLVNAEYDFAAAGQLFDQGLLRVYTGLTDVAQRTLDERGLAGRPVSIDRFFDFKQRLEGAELNLQKTLGGDFATHRLAFGVEFRRRRTAEFRDGLETGIDDGAVTNVLLGEVFPLRDFPLSRSVERGAYVEDSIERGRWRLIGALRFDRYDLDPDNDPMYAADYPFAEPVSMSESEVSPKLGVIFRPAERVDVYVQYAHGFRAPPYEDANIGLEMPVFNYRAIPNPDLRSERSDGVDLGLRWRGDAGSMRLSLFRTEYEDFIESKVRIGTDPVSGRILFQSQNVDAAQIEGVEAAGSIEFDGAGAAWSLDTSLYRARGRNGDSGAPLNSVGPPEAVFGVDWAPFESRWQGRLKARLSGPSRVDETGGALFRTPGYAVFDLFFSRSLGEAGTLRAGIMNLSDRRYWVWSDVRGLAPDDPVLPYLARPGRSLVVGLDAEW